MISRLRWRSLVVVASAVCVIGTPAFGPAFGQESGPPQREQDEKKQEEKNQDQKEETGETQQQGQPEKATPPGPRENPYTGDEEIPPRPPASDRDAYLEWRAKAALIMQARDQRKLDEAPRITFIDGTERQLGTVYDHNVQTLEFPFKNEGKSELLIGGMFASCGCTVAELEKAVYQPGEEGVIKVTFDPLNRSGFQHKYVEAATNDPRKSRLRLRFEAEVEQLISISPPFLTMPQVVQGVPESGVVWVFGRTDDFEAEITPSGSYSWLDIEKVETKEEFFQGERRRGSRFLIRVNDRAPMGRHSVNLQVTSNDERADGRQIGFNVGVLGDVGYRPLRVNMGQVEPGDIYEQTIQIYSRTATPFKLTSASLQGRLRRAGTELDWDIAALGDEAGDVYDVTVRFEIPPEPLLSGHIAFRTNRSNQPEVRVPYTGSVKMPEQQAQDAGGGGAIEKPATPPEKSPPKKKVDPPKTDPEKIPPPVVPPPASAV